MTKANLKWNDNARRGSAVEKFKNFGEDERNCFMIENDYSETDIKNILADKGNGHEAFIEAIMNFTMECLGDPVLSDIETLAGDFENICGYSHCEAQEAAANVMNEDCKNLY